MRTAALVIFLGLAPLAQAELRIDVHQEQMTQIPIAIVPFTWSDPARVDTLAEVVADDLRRSGLFEVLRPRQMPQRDLRQASFDPELWRASLAEYVVTAHLTPTDDGKAQLDYQLWDVVAGTSLARKRIVAPLRVLRRIAHRLADQVHEQLTGVRGVFDTRIAYVSREPGGRRFRLIVADSDGHNPISLLASDRPLLAPAWSPDGQELAYVSFERGAPQIYLHSLKTGKRLSVLRSGTQATAPAYSPDGTYLALSVIRGRASDIFLYHRKTGALSRITRGGINTEPAWIADDWLLYTSNRSGKPTLYRQQIGSSQAHALALPGRANTDASVSPDGIYVAMVHVGDHGSAGLYLADLQANSMRALSSGALDESPSFAPNGQALLYAATDPRHGRVLVWSDRSGRIRHHLQTPYDDVREPSWSPYR